jgi:hypothetical protein
VASGENNLINDYYLLSVLKQLETYKKTITEKDFIASNLSLEIFTFIEIE